MTSCNDQDSESLEASAMGCKHGRVNLRYIKTIMFLVKGLKVVAMCCFQWVSFHDDLCHCVEYSNVENQVEIFNASYER